MPSAQSTVGLFAVLMLIFVTACNRSEPVNNESAMNNQEQPGLPGTVTETDTPEAINSISRSFFGTTANGEKAELFTMRNTSGMVVKITNYGGIVVALTTPDRDGQFEDIVLGYDTLAEYETESPYFGALIGRYGNRIGKGQFVLNGTVYQLTLNDGPNHLHGGERGFDKVVWEAAVVDSEAGPSLALSYVSEDGEEGYPGSLQANVRYTLTDENELVIDYSAETDKATPVNLTHHSYFNLTGNAKRSILTHELEIPAEHFTPVDATLIPTGELRPVAGTPFDFRGSKPIGRDIEADNQQIRFGLGYDHNWVVDSKADGEWRHVATLSEPESGRIMKVFSSEPGLQFYSGNFLDGSITGKGVTYEHRYGLCLETQHFPDSPNQSGFPDTILLPGQVYKTKTVYAFSSGEVEF